MARRPLLKRIIDSFGSVPATIRFSEPLPASRERVFWREDASSVWISCSTAVGIDMYRGGS